MQECASIIKQHTRLEDIVARYGGEEIVVLLPNTEKDKAEFMADRIRHEVQKKIFCHEERSIRVTMSGGVASFPIDTRDDENLVGLADDAMYQAKYFGKNNIIPFYPKDRQSKRFAYKAEVGIRSFGKEEIQNFSATSKNISIKGFLIESDTPLSLSTTIEISIHMKKNKILLIGKVVRVKQVSFGKYEIGVSFPKRIKENIADHLLKSHKGYNNTREAGIQSL